MPAAPEEMPKAKNADGDSAATIREARLELLDDGRWRVGGSLTLASIGDLLPETERLVAGGGVVELDLGGVRHSSSAAVALLLEWQSLLHRTGGRLQIENCPEALWRIADFSNVDVLLGLTKT